MTEIIIDSTSQINITFADAPIANDKNYTTYFETALNGNVITDSPADSDPNGDPLTVSSYTNPSNGSVTINNDGSFTYTPNANYSGSDSFDYIITDGTFPSVAATVTIDVLEPQADLGIVKSGPSTVLAGASITYNLNVTNANGTGFTDALDVTITDNLPSGMTFNGIVAPSEWSCTFSTGTITCENPSVAAGYSGVITINAIAPFTSGDINNTANVSSVTQDNNAANNSSTLTTTITDNSTDLSITKTANPNPVITASLLTYTINVSNVGSNAADGILVTDILPNELLFVSVDGGTDWSCAQGQVVTCNYLSTGGVLAAGATSGDITLTVTTPVQATTVLNEASVTSATPDSNPTNNTDDVTVTVEDGTSTGSDVDLTKYLQFNLFGDMRLIGNANINSDEDDDYNDRVDMQYVNTAGGSFNSSSSYLDLNTSHKIIWAGLYWEGHVCSNDDDGRDDGEDTGCDWSNSSYRNFNDADDHLGEVRLKTPNRSGYIDITANSLNIIDKSGNDNIDWTYSAFADITHLIDADEVGTYSVADIALTEGQIFGGGNYGGWAILVIYEDPSNTLQYKNISVFNGFQYMYNDGNIIDIDGFVTPQSGNINASIAFFAADGDPVVGGTGQMRIGTSNNYDEVGQDPLNPTTNLLNSTISEFGTAINPGVTRTYGVDADRIDVSSFMENGQTDTRFIFDTSTGNGRDAYTISMFAFATDLTSPIIDDFTKSAQIIDINGTIRNAGPGVAIYPGNELLYTLIFQNSGDEVAELVEIFDDFDFDGLAPALDLVNFDATKIKLYSGPGTSTPVVNPDCGFDPIDRRVWCNLDTVGIDQIYTMQFAVSIANPLDPNLFDENATNTAYSMYKNPNGDNYVLLKSTPEGDLVGGSSNTFNAGTLTNPGSGGTSSMISVDAINQNYSYTEDRNITTKIVNEPFSIKLVHIDKQGNNTGYQAWLDNKGNYRPMPVILTLCTDNTEVLADPATVQFTQGTSEIIVPNIILDKAHRDDRMKMGYIDWNEALTWPDENSPCVTNSNDAANLNGVPQCFNAWIQASDVFPEDEYPYVKNTCYGLGSSFPSGKDAACDSQAYSNNGDTPSGNIYPDIYNNSYGCYQCLTDAFSEFNNCSTDNFAARPDHFEIESTNPHYPDLLRSALDYNLSLFAYDGSYDPDHYTTNYNQYKNNLDINQTLYLSDDTEDTNNDLAGTLSFGSSDYNITDGESIAIVSGSLSNEVVGIKFDDVAKVGIRIEDHNWAFADIDDTPQDCFTNQVVINGSTLSIEAPAYICGEINATFIPHHFNVTDIHLNNHAQTTFTYLSNDLNMSAHVDVTISAMNADDAVTQNFTQGNGFYENPVSVDLNVTEWKPAPSLHPLGNAVIIKDIPVAQLLGFGSPDANGTHTIPWNESNATQKIMFNYVREINQVVNPFDVNGSELNITVVRHIHTYSYSDTPEGTAI